MNPEQQIPQTTSNQPIGAQAPGGFPAAQPQQPQPQRKANPNSTQSSLLFADFRDGIVIMQDGSYRAVIACQSINFDLMSPEEQEAVEYSYQGFLNSLYFSIQIHIKSQKVDIRPYIDKLDKIRSEHDNMLLALLMEDYIAYISNLAMQANIMDKHFYVIVPYSNENGSKLDSGKSFFSNMFGPKKQQIVITEKELETAKTELRNRVQAVMAGLQQSGIQSVPLDTNELIELFYDSYNPDTATRQKLREFKSQKMDALVVMKGEGRAAQPHLDRELQ